jgi:uncharacterized protein (TIGR01777 family)
MKSAGHAVAHDMKHTILISGASGMVGRPLIHHLTAAGHTIRTLVRRPPAGEGEYRWDPTNGELEPAALDGVSAVINLNGKNIASERWSPSVRDALRSSRLDSTTTLVSAIQAADTPPSVLINASATGFFGDRGDEELTEESARGNGFLADLSEAWENAALAVASKSTRVVPTRFGMVIGDGGALAKMLPIFRLGLGGPIGNGRQFWPWIHIDDVVGGIEFLLDAAEVGPVNFVAPDTVRCRDFAATLGRVLHRPAFLPAPAFAVKLAMGEMADALLLASSRVLPARLTDAGYVFRFPSLEAALCDAVS